jgi:hypothetical protein
MHNRLASDARLTVLAKDSLVSDSSSSSKVITDLNFRSVSYAVDLDGIAWRS